MPRKKTDTAFEEKPGVQEVSLEEIVADRFSRYSKYIIQERALPDARDGLKPVQRRILWSMYEDGNTWNKPYRKSAKTVGNVIGNYHPHGDSSVYDAIVRMSQDWKTRLPLIDMQGNNGSIDDDPAAAMRYTEARLSKIADALMQDLDKETVEWAPNFSDEKMEPTVFPAAYPNLLINGVTGIAAGYATNIPPHNFNEALEATIYRLKNPDCTLDDLMEIIPGPDFPTGGIVMGKDGIRQAFETGKGRIMIRGKARIEEGKTINQIIVDEIPYEVIKSAMVKQMDDIRFSGKVNGILDIRDESGRDGLRIAIDLKKEANAQAILNYFYKKTDLQVSYNYNTIAIVNKAPRQLGLIQILDAFLAHREEIIIRRSRFDLNARQKRQHIVEGLIKAVDVLDEIIAMIRASKGKAESKQKIMDAFGFDDVQAEAIVTLQLYRLSNTDVTALKNENDQLIQEIARLEALLASKAKRKTLMIKELTSLNKEFDVPRKSVILDEIEEVVLDEKDMISEEQVMLTISRQGYLKRTSMRSYNSAQSVTGLREGDDLLYIAQVSTLDTLHLFTANGKYGSVPVFKIEEGKWKDIGKHASAIFKMDDGDQIAAAFLSRKPFENSRLIFTTRLGMIKAMDVSMLAQKGLRMQTVMNLANGDEVADVSLSRSPQESRLLISSDGYGLKVPLTDIPVQGAKTRGVKGIKLGADQKVAGVLDGSKEFVLESMQGSLKRLDAASMEDSRRALKGLSLYKNTKKSHQEVLDAISWHKEPYTMQDESEQDLSGLSRMALHTPSGAASGWSSQVIEKPARFVRDLQSLTSGIWTNPEEETEEDPGQQLSLFAK